jgi:hypothetical protein
MDNNRDSSDDGDSDSGYVPRDKRVRVDLTALRAAVMHRSIISEREEKFARAGLSSAALEEMDPRYEKAARERQEQTAREARERALRSAAKVKEVQEKESEMAGFRPGDAPKGSLYRRFVHDESNGEGGRSRSRSRSPPNDPTAGPVTKPRGDISQKVGNADKIVAQRPEHFAPRKQGNHIGAPTNAEIKRFNRTLLGNAVMEVHPTTHTRVEGRRVLPPPEHRR